MRTTVLAVIALLAASVSLFAQEKGGNENIRYSNITEFGVFTTSPLGIAIEATTVQGFSIDKQHYIGLGIGFGGSFHSANNTAYMPIFANYRYYFNPNKVFSPHTNIALGGMAVRDGEGIYSAITMGFKAGHFSFSSGLSFMAIHAAQRYDYRYFNKTWYYPFGITLKCGFSF